MISKKIVIKTYKRKEVIDITDLIYDELKAESAKEGICHLFLTHTTAALTIADLDPGTDLDMLDAFEAMVPKFKYRHPHDPGHVGEHILSSLIGCSLVLTFKDSKLLLGVWQRVVLIEFSGPREREIILSIF